MDRTPNRPSSKAAEVAPEAKEACCLACASCGQAICTAESLIRNRVYSTLREAVYAYELSLLGVPVWCYSATGQSGNRCDVVLLEEVCVGRAPGTAALTGRARRAAGVVVSTTQAPPTSDHCWFPGFRHQAVRCGGCSVNRLLGWAFTPDSGESTLDGGPRASGFFGIIVTRLRERPLVGAREWTPSAAAVHGRCMQLRGLTASTVSGTSAAGAAGAARMNLVVPAALTQRLRTSSASDAPGDAKAARLRRRDRAGLLVHQ